MPPVSQNRASLLERMTGRDKSKGPVQPGEAFKPNWLSSFEPAKAYRGWKNVTGAPIGSALAAAGLAAGGAYLTAPWLAKGLLAVRNKMPGVKPIEPIEEEEEIKRMRKRMAIVAALLGGGLSVATHFDPKYPWKSMTDWNYMNKEGSLKKEADLYANPAIMQQDIIPLDHAKEIVANDPYLNSSQKAAIGTIFNKTPDQKGNASMADITAGAIRAGLGYAGGAVAGYALGKIFSLPAPITRAASMAGGIANALRTSGLIT